MGQLVLVPIPPETLVKRTVAGKPALLKLNSIHLYVVIEKQTCPHSALK